MLELSDQEVVKLTLEDNKNYKELVNRYENKLLRYIKRILYIGNEDAEDILQESFIKAYKNLNSYNSKYKFSSWIYRITHNEAISYLRKNIKKRNSDIKNDNEESILDNLASDLDLEAEMIKKDTKKIVNNALKSSDQKYRDVLILKFLEEMDYNEISNVLDMFIWYCWLISRAKVKLKELIDLMGERVTRKLLIKSIKKKLNEYLNGILY